MAPTTVLGLFVVGRLARRHGLSVQLDHSRGRGVTATVRIPVRLLTTAAKVLGHPDPAPGPAVAVPDPRRRPTQPLSSGASLEAVSRLAAEVAAIGSAEPFHGSLWTVRSPRRPDGHGGTAPAGPARATVRHRPGSAPLRANGPAASVGARRQRPRRERRRNAPDAEPTAPARTPVPAGAAATVNPRTGLARRVPGTHMVGRARSVPPPPADRPARPARDPEAERDALNDYFPD